jgi:hypothetical protein
MCPSRCKKWEVDLFLKPLKEGTRIKRFDTMLLQELTEHLIASCPLLCMWYSVTLGHQFRIKVRLIGSDQEYEHLSLSLQ